MLQTRERRKRVNTVTVWGKTHRSDHKTLVASTNPRKIRLLSEIKATTERLRVPTLSDVLLRVGVII